MIDVRRGSNNNMVPQGWDVVQSVKCLPQKCEDLGSRAGHGGAIPVLAMWRKDDPGDKAASVAKS